ncbi:MAG: nucleoside:proton symporter [Candidatus Krumholzibacteria bacterium]|nr:nucleoside:proton symporter [Candidatus Krumholzibacteria bacterium]
MMIVQGILGLAAFVFLAWLMSENRRKVSARMILTGLGLQLVVGVILLKLSFFRAIFLHLNKAVTALEQSTAAGSSVVFGYLAGGDPPFDVTNPAAVYLFAFRSLPLVLFMSALSALLFYWKILPAIVRSFSWALQRSMRIGGAEGLGVAANVFVGMVEAPLLIRPYLKDMTRSELFAVMTCGMATIAGTVLVLYATMLDAVIPNALGHILTASIISAPAAIMIAKIMVPETGEVTSGKLTPVSEYRSSMDAITKGTMSGIQLLLSIVAMIIVLVAFVHLINIILSVIPDAGGRPITLERLLGYVMAPAMWLAGVPWGEAATAGSLMGTKTVLNELIAYFDLSHLEPGALSDRSRLIVMYAMCGFANPGSLGIMIGGMGAMAPERREEIVALGFRSIAAGTIATCMTGAVAGLFMG